MILSARIPPVWAALRAGDFIDRPRILRVAAALLLASLIGLGALVLGSDGLHDYKGRPLGSDFANVWSAGRMALDGRAAEAFDPPTHYAEQEKLFGDDTPFYGWHYPPLFLLAAALLAFLPYTAGLAVWQGATLALYLRSIGFLASGRKALFLALAFPAVFVNAAHGQNGFLTAALIGGALVILDRRPILAGVLIGLLAYKPQFGVLLPLVLALTGRWRTFAAAAATVIALAAAATALFGAEIWPAFLDGARYTRNVVLEEGQTGWEKIQSLFSAARALGAPVSLAYALQAGLALFVAGAVAAIWRSKADHADKSAALIAGSLLATPYLLDYDLMALAPAIALLAAGGIERGFRPFEKSLLTFVFLAPLFARGLAEATLIPAGFLSIVMVFAIALNRSRPHLNALTLLRRPVAAAAARD